MILQFKLQNSGMQEIRGKNPGKILFQGESLLSPVFFLSLHIYVSRAQSLHKTLDITVCISAPSPNRH